MTDRRISITQVLSRKRREVFLKVLAKTGKVAEAASAAGYSTSSQLYRMRETDEAFAQEWDAAIYASADRLEAAAWDRAVDGVHKPVFFKGEIVGSEVQYSDALLIELLRAKRPKEYRKPNQAVDVNVEVNAKIGVAIVPITATDPDDWERQVSRMQEQQKKLPSFYNDKPVIEGHTTEVSSAPVAESVPAQSKPAEEPTTGTFSKSIERG